MPPNTPIINQPHNTIKKSPKSKVWQPRVISDAPNRYDKNGQKHGQWVEDSGLYIWINNYDHGKKDGVQYGYLDEYLSFIEECKQGKTINIWHLNQNRLRMHFYDFEECDTTFHNGSMMQHFIGRCKVNAYHNNGDIEAIDIVYFDEEGPEMDCSYVIPIYRYDEKGNQLHPTDKELSID